MSVLIETRPSAVMFGEFHGYDSITQNDVSRVAGRLDESYIELPPGSQMSGQVSQLHAPIAIPAESGTEDKNCLWECLLGGAFPVVGVAGAGAVASGSVPKSWVGIPHHPGSSRFTSVPSIIAHKWPRLAAVKVPKFVPNRAPVVTRGGIAFKPSGNLLRFVGRWIPGIGFALLAADLIVLDQCIAQCSGERSYLRAICEELTLFCAKPAY